MSYSKALAAIGLVASASVAAVAGAEEAAGGYAGVLVSRLSSSESGASPQPRAISGVLGYSVSSDFAIEGRFGTGLGSDTVTVLSPSFGAVNVGVKVKSYYGAYLRGAFPLSDSFSLYGLTGYADGKIEGSAMGYTVSASDSGFSWFVGGEVNFGPDRKQSFAVEWGRVLSNTDALSVLYRFRF
jgi:hypothetical protein